MEVLMSALQWGGAAVVIVGYLFFVRGETRTAAWLTVAGAGLLIGWAYLASAGGIAFLNLVILGINAWALRPRR